MRGTRFLKDPVKLFPQTPIRHTLLDYPAVDGLDFMNTNSMLLGVGSIPFLS
jgi:hypothetical protein